IQDYAINIHKALSGKGALAILEKNPVDVVVSDIRMPGMSGLELCELIRQRAPKSKIIFLTGYRDFNSVYQAVQKGNVRYLIKTENDATISKTITGAIRELEQELRNEGAADILRAAARSLPESAPGKVPEKSPANRIMGILLHHISAHLRDDLTLTALSELTRRNPSYLSRLFKQETGMNVSDYILMRRIEAAKILLRSTNKKIQDIAHAVGYQSGHSFSRLFRKVTGMSPQNYRIPPV
ncbi:MAG: helix-turn-helix domain-containing protein, partial [Treponema sp.]|nr:helix-turn-helix domain-containing protein [Treponema sp.]